MLRSKIEKYLRIPIWFTLFFVVLDGFMLVIDRKSGVIMGIGVICYLLIALLVYYHFKPDVMSELVNFAFEQGQIQKELLKELAIPYVLVDKDTRILWSNKEFKEKISADKTGKHFLSQVIPEVTKEILPQGLDKVEHQFVFADRTFRAEMKKVEVDFEKKEQEEASSNQDFLYAIYFFDETELQNYIQENKDQKLVSGLIYIDNYEEALESIEEVRRSLLVALVDRKVNKYMQNIDAICKKLDKDKFLIVFQQKYLAQLQQTKFSILDEIRAINIGNEMAVTLSISLGVNAPTWTLACEYARVAMDLALGRGGDQAVIKDQDKIYYYGGKTQVVEKSTRVKARVKAHALREMLETKDKVVIMGHQLPDVDSLGAAIGIYRLAKAMNKNAHIVINEATISIRPVLNNFLGNPNYEEDMFMDNETAMDYVDNNTALIVVDVSRPSYTECAKLLELTKAVVVFDHHRQTNETIPNAVLSYIEPYASSTCEMIAEILQYIVDKPKLKPIEADAMYSGILVDTDNFVTKTGVRTFEAAAYLRRSGADVTRVRKMFRTDMGAYKIRAEAVHNAEVFMDYFAISIFPSAGIDSPTVLAAQVANELLDIARIRASFVFTNLNGKVYISARSIDDVNVQVIMERLGGGGHLTVAGAQLTGVTSEEAVSQLKEILSQLIEEGDI